MKIIQLVLNFLPQFRGKLRIARYLVKSKNREIKFTTLNKVVYTVPNLIENVSFELYINGIYEKQTIEFICSSIPRNGTFVDVGANIGAICVEVARRRPDVNVNAFEASPRVFQYLIQNSAQNNLSNLEIHNLAIHEVGGIELPFFSPLELNGKGSFSPVYTSTPEMVKTVRLDDFLMSRNIIPNFIKIDVEGFELLIFKSIFKLDLKSSILLFEFVDWAESAAGFKIGSAQKYLLDKGFCLKNFSNDVAINAPIVAGNAMIIAQV